MEWQILTEILKANAKQLPAVVLMAIIIVVLWKAWRKEAKEKDQAKNEMIRYLKSLVRPDDSSDS